MNQPLVSFIICTYNRADILSRCLESLILEEPPSFFINVIVVDNNSKDHTKETVSRFASKAALLFPVAYLKELKVGLSYARNAGLHHAIAPWVFYLDDDAMITPGFYRELKRCIDSDFSGFTGVFSPYYIGDKPDWLHPTFGSKKAFRSDLGPLEDDYLCGNVMGFKKDVLLEIGGFPTSLGMNGYKIAYGEETYVENTLRKKEYSLGINPRLKILHLVAGRKQTFSWNLKSHFAIGQSQKRIGLVNQNFFWDSLKLFFKHSFIEVPKLLLYRPFKQGYSLKYLSLKILETYWLLAGRIFYFI